MDLVFKALADASRRKLLDRLQAKDGQTLRELCVDLAMTRQAVTKHLLLLEAAGLVSTQWQGREKLHHLNPAPLQKIAARWLGKYKQLQPVASQPQPVKPAIVSETEGDSRWTNLHAV
jgi:DNA-binding transcriptional ArsR family regulator